MEVIIEVMLPFMAVPDLCSKVGCPALDYLVPGCVGFVLVPLASTERLAGSGGLERANGLRAGRLATRSASCPVSSPAEERSRHLHLLLAMPRSDPGGLGRKRSPAMFRQGPNGRVAAPDWAVHYPTIYCIPPCGASPQANPASAVGRARLAGPSEPALVADNQNKA